MNGALIVALPLLLAFAPVAPAPPGGAVRYATTCASCHGADGFGSTDGPSLHGVGLAAVDFYLGTGRMPAAVPWVEAGHRHESTGQQLPLADIRALETFLAPMVAGGPAIPMVVAGGDLTHGRALYALHCEQCHAVGGTGGGIGASDWAPALDQATINDVADAIRVGPYEMPRFGEHQLSQSDLDDVATYVMNLQTVKYTTSPPPFATSGPIPEGALGYVAILLLVMFVFVFWRRDTPPAKREEAVRRDEGEGRKP